MRTPSISATAWWRPMSTKTPSVLYVNFFKRPWPRVAATFSPTRLPWRSACCAVGGDGRLPPNAGLDEDPARAVQAGARVAVDHIGHVVLELRDSLEARVAGADEHECQPRAALGRVVERLRDLEVQQRAIAQCNRFGQGLEAQRVLGEAGHGHDA